MAEESARRISKEETWGSLVLWFVVLAGPTAWSLHLLVNYMLEEFISCTPGSMTPGEILGFGVPAIVIAVNAVLLVITAAAGVAAVRALRTLPRVRPDGSPERARWMAVVGIMNSVLFGLVIAVGMFPPFILGVCITAT